MLLEVGDHPRQRRGRNAQPIRRTHEAPGFDDADKGFHAGETIHVLIIP
jgi:hypothetical protein